jgi:hypothetical protein
MTIIEFFTLDRLIFAGANPAHAKWILKQIHKNNSGIRIGANFENAYTLDKLLSAETPIALLQTQGIGYRSADILLRTLDDADHRFKIRQCVTRREYARYIRDHSKE